MSFNIWNDVAFYKLWNPKNKILDLNLTKKKDANRPRPYLLLFSFTWTKKKRKKEKKKKERLRPFLSFLLSFFLTLSDD